MLRFLVITLLLLCATLLGAQDTRNLVQLDHWYAAGMAPDGHTPWYNEVWGFEQNGREYAVIGSRDGTHILEINHNRLTERFFIAGASHGPFITNRDFMDHKGYLYAVCDQGYATLQIIDLHQLPQTLHLVYDSDSVVSRAHTVWIDAATDKMYLGGPPGYAMLVFDISQPLNPQPVYAHTAQAYIHDMFVRNDTAFLNAGYEGLHLYDFSGTAPYYYYGSVQAYTDAGYNHSGKLSADGKWYVFTDETNGSRIKLYDVSDLTDPKPAAVFSSGGDAQTIAHDPVFWKQYIFVSYYYDGLVVFDASNPYQPKKIAWFNPYEGEHVPMSGNWGVFVLPSGKVLMSDRQNGLYLLEFLEPPSIHAGTGTHGVYPNPLSGEGYFYYGNNRQLQYRFEAYDATGKKVFSQDTPTNFLRLEAGSFSPGVYQYRFYGNGNDIAVSGQFVVVH